MSLIMIVTALVIAAEEFLPPAYPEELRTRSNVYNVLRLVAECSFLLSVAFAARRTRAPVLILICCLVTGIALILANPSNLRIPPQQELEFGLGGALCLLVSGTWLAWQQWSQERRAAMAIGLGSVVGVFGCLQIVGITYAWHVEALAGGWTTGVSWLLRVATAYSVASLLMLSGAALDARVRVRRAK